MRSPFFSHGICLRSAAATLGDRCPRIPGTWSALLFVYGPPDINIHSRRICTRMHDTWALTCVGAWPAGCHVFFQKRNVSTCGDVIPCLRLCCGMDRPVCSIVRKPLPLYSHTSAAARDTETLAAETLSASTWSGAFVFGQAFPTRSNHRDFSESAWEWDRIIPSSLAVIIGERVHDESGMICNCATHILRGLGV